jgi:hypothetical protein
VLTSFSPSIIPALGYVEDFGAPDEDKPEPKEYPADYYQGQTACLLGTRAPYSTRIKITGPADFTINSVGIKTEETVIGTRRTVVWESDHPVSFYNIVAGRWDVKRGHGTEVYYHPGHPYNVDEMVECLDAASITPTGSFPTPGRSSSSASSPAWPPMHKAFQRTSLSQREWAF